jgi:hypothetical protein
VSTCLSRYGWYELGAAIGKLRRLRYLELHRVLDCRAHHAVGRGVAASGGCPELVEVCLATDIATNIGWLTHQPSLIVPSVRDLHIGAYCTMDEALLLCCGLVQAGYRYLFEFSWHCRPPPNMNTSSTTFGGGLGTSGAIFGAPNPPNGWGAFGAALGGTAFGAPNPVGVGASNASEFKPQVKAQGVSEASVRACMREVLRSGGIRAVVDKTSLFPRVFKHSAERTVYRVNRMSHEHHDMTPPQSGCVATCRVSGLYELGGVRTTIGQAYIATSRGPRGERNSRCRLSHALEQGFCCCS